MIQERGASAKRAQADRRESLMSSSSQERRAYGKPDAMFSSGSQETGNQFKSSVFKNADPSNLGRSLVEGNKDHVLSQARSDLKKQEHQVGSLHDCISELQQQAYAQRLELQDAQHGYTESRREQVRLQGELSLKEKVLRDTQIRRMHVMGDMKRAQELRVDEVSVQKIERKSWDNTKARFRNTGNARTDEFYEWFRRISRSGIESQWEIVLRFQSTCNNFKVLVPCWPATNACLLTHGIHLDYRKTFLVINFPRLVHPEIILKEFTLAHHKENKDQFHKQQGQRLFSQEMTNKKEAQFQCRRLHRILWLDRKDSKYRSCNSTTSLVHNHFWFWKIRFENLSDYLFRFSLGCCVMDQRGGDGWFTRGIEVLAIRFWKEFPKFEMLDAKIASALNKIIQNSHLIQEEGQSRETESTKKRIGFYEEDRSPSWSTTTFEWLALMTQ